MRSVLVVLLATACAASGVSTESTNSSSARVTRVIAGVTYEYAPEAEAVVQELAPLVTALDRENAEQARTSTSSATEPLSVQDLQDHRADYLARIAAAIGLEKATALQEECYGAYLDLFRQTDWLSTTMRKERRQLAEVRAIAIWSKEDLKHRLKAGEKVAGFSLDPDGEHVSFNWSGQMGLSAAMREQLAAMAEEREKRSHAYSFNWSVKDGVVSFSAGVRPRQVAQNSPLEPAGQTSVTTPLPAFPLVITPDQASLPPAKLAAEFARNLRDFRAKIETALPVDNQAQLAFMILHETTEIGIVDRFIASADRRWFCEGVANYTAWKIAHDVGGETLARKVYDVQAQLAQYAGFRDKIDLRRWPAVENQSKEDADTTLTKAHYAYATRAVCLMVERHGDDFLPRLFREVGQTPRMKTTMATVAKAYKKLGKEKLADIIDAALAPLAPGAPRQP